MSEKTEIEQQGESRHGVRLGIDIGGTFTDLLVLDEATGQLRGRAKISTTPADPSIAAMQGVTELRAADGVASQISYVCHATTVITNALLQRRTARGGMITTRGFRDVLEIARMVRPHLYDLNVERLPPLVPRERIMELSERMNASGEALRPLQLEEVDAAVRTLLDEDVDCIAICLINAYANPEHERAVAKRVAELAPGLAICISTDLVQEYREYQRMSSTVVNAVTMPAFAGYIHRFADNLRRESIAAPFYLMQSNGGMMRAEAARVRPINFVESGPAAGVIAAARLGVLSGFRDVLSFDMGGTTAKVGLIQNGVPLTTSEYSVGGPTHGRAMGASATGYPIRVPVLDLVEVGTGGGSIAHLDASGGLHVGPVSAGADPGPMCYGRGGEHPTVTDAHVVTGVIDPRNFLGGRMQLDPALSFRGVERLSMRLGMDVMSTAKGIIDIADAAMLQALRIMSVERGVDPRHVAMIAFGGAGPMRAAALGGALGVKRVVIPREPGLFSALGLLLTDVRRDEVRSYIRDLARVDAAELGGIVGGMAAHVDAQLQSEGLLPEQRSSSVAMDLRYRGQSYELSVPVPSGPITPEILARAAADFHDIHNRRYGYNSPNGAIQIVGVRVCAVGALSSVTMARSAQSNGDAQRARTGTREIYLGRDGATRVGVYDRELLMAGDSVQGPAVLEQFDSTILVQPGQSLTVDPLLSLVIS